jgi:hypothetical protein
MNETLIWVKPSDCRFYCVLLLLVNNRDVSRLGLKEHLSAQWLSLISGPSEEEDYLLQRNEWFCATTQGYQLIIPLSLAVSGLRRCLAVVSDTCHGRCCRHQQGIIIGNCMWPFCQRVTFVTNQISKEAANMRDFVFISLDQGYSILIYVELDLSILVTIMT